MSEKFKELQKSLVKELRPISQYPNFVIKSKIEQMNYSIGDYKLEYDDEWSHGTTYLKFGFGKAANWDYGKSDELQSIIKKYPRFEILQPKQNPEMVKTITSRTPITQKMLYDNFLVFDKYNYENDKPEDIFRHMKNDHEGYMAQWDGIAKSRAEAERWFADRIVAAINYNTIRFWDLMLLDGAELLEDIGSKIFGAKIQ